MISNSIEGKATVDINNVLSELDNNEVAEYFHIGDYNDSTPLE